MKKYFFLLSLVLWSSLSQSAAFYEGLMLDVKDFNALAPSVQESYMKSVRKYFAEFEKDIGGKRKMSEQARNFNFNSLFESIAYAADDTCLVGGAEVPFKNGACSTRTQPCTNAKKGINDPKNGFQCGPVFASECISRTPVDNISIRCSEEKVDLKIYKGTKESISALFNKNCTKPKLPSLLGCQKFSSRMRMLTHTASFDAPVVETEKTNTAVQATATIGRTTASTPTPEQEDSDAIKTKCAAKISDFKEKMDKNLIEEKGKTSFRAALHEGKVLYEDFVKLTHTCQTENCKKIFSSNQVFQSYYPVSDTHNVLNLGIRYNQDIQAYAIVLALAQNKKPEDRKAEDLDKLIERLRWQKNGVFHRRLREAYMKDRTFTGGESALLENFLSMGQGIGQKKTDDYRDWMKYWEGKLKDEEEMIEKVFFADKNLTAEELQIALKIKRMNQEGREISERLRATMGKIKTDMADLKTMPPQCFHPHNHELFPYILFYNNYRPPGPGPAGGDSPGQSTK